MSHFALRYLLNSSLVLLLTLSLNIAISPGADLTLESVSASETLVPQNLLKLLHAAEVQKELGFEGAALDDLVMELVEIDKEWWPVRIRPQEEQRKVIAKLENRLVDFLKQNLSKEKQTRLKQIELQSQGTRMFAREDVSKAIGLSKTQISQLEKQFSKTDKLVAESSRSPDKVSATELETAQKNELKIVTETLSEKQKTEFSKMMGPAFDTVSLKRIYPLAPELVDSAHWAGASPVTLADQRGKVVLVHFYAFECHNCVANFGHYKKWHKELSERGVQVVGIQTPETAAERDVSAVRKAAKDRGFEFPVLIDIKNENWDAWGNTMWPTVYVIDKQGYIRFWWQGELNWQGATVDKKIEQIVTALLEEDSSSGK